jgi:hypothetical protein
MANDDNEEEVNDIVLVCLARYKASGKVINDTYQALYKHYLKWLQSNAENAVLGLELAGIGKDGPLTITQHNVESYFQNAVVSMVGSKEAIKRKFNALLWYLKHVESDRSQITFSPTIQRAIEDQQDHNVENAALSKAGCDPHYGLKDVMSQDDTSKIVDTIYRYSKDSLDLAFSYLWGANAAVRGSSTRKIVLCDLTVSYGFGPDAHPPYNRTLLMVLRKGLIHKDRHDLDREVGVQRHVDYRKCAVFATGALVLTKLFDYGDNCSFLHVNKKERCDWWDIKLNNYSTYNPQAKAMLNVFKIASVCNSKLTHHRTQAVQYAGSRGLLPSQINTFTKHMLDKQHSSYQPECDEEAMKVMSGFKKVSRIVPQSTYYNVFTYIFLSNLHM